MEGISPLERGAFLIQESLLKYDLTSPHPNTCALGISQKLQQEEELFETQIFDRAGSNIPSREGICEAQHPAGA